MSALAEPRVVLLPGKSPLVTLRFVFTTGSASDPADKPGLAHLHRRAATKSGGSKDLTYKQVVDAMYPTATSVEVSTDKEMTTFVGETHRDNLDKFYGLMRDIILHPGWRADDFERVRDDSINELRVNLRGNNDEELGKEELYNAIYKGQPYGHENLGTISALRQMTVADLQAFHQRHYTQANLIIGLAGGYSPEFLARVKRDFATLPAGHYSIALTTCNSPLPLPAATLPWCKMATRSRRMVARISARCEARRSRFSRPARHAVLARPAPRRAPGDQPSRMRELRGLNYGDYAYLEYFPRGMSRFEPSPNIARHQQIFQIWIRPVEQPNAVFSLRLALFELDKMVKNGIPQADFEKTRSFLSKYVNILTKTKSAISSSAMRVDSEYYGIPNYNEYIKAALAKLTAADVNAAIRRHMRADNIEIVGVAKDTGAITAALTRNDPTPIHYNAPKPQDVLDEDKIVERWPLHLRKEDVTVVPVDKVFEN